MRELASITTHRLFRNGPLVLFEQHESFSLADAHAATTIYAQIIAEEGYLLLLLDFREGSGVDTDVRRHLAHWSKEHAERFCIAAIGGNFVLRTTLTLILTAARVLGGRQPDVQFFAATEAGKAWLAARGAKLAAARERSQAPTP